MNDSKKPKPDRRLRRDATTHRLDGPDALLTAEWDVHDMPWLASLEGAASSADTPSEDKSSADETSANTAEPGAPAAAGRAPEESERGEASPVRTVITRPKPVRPISAPPPAVLVAGDLGATLPPREERDAAQSEVPSVEFDAGAPPGGILGRFKRPSPIAALVTLLSASTLYAVSSRLIAPGQERSRQAAVPEFLRQPEPSSAEAPSSEAPSSGAPPVVSPSLPPEFGGTLAEALTGSPSGPADAGASHAPPPPAPPAPEPLLARPAGASGASPSAPAAEPPRPPGPNPRARSKAPTVAAAAPTAPRASAAVAKPLVRAPESPAPAPRPAAEGVVRPLTTYTYADKALFSVATAPMRVTDLVLQPGEKLVSRPTAGDPARWVVSVIDSVSRGEPQSHVFVKPLRAGLRTNLTITTDRRSYFLELSSSSDGTYIAGVEWKYPRDEAERRRRALGEAERERQNATEVSDLASLSFEYRVEVLAGTPDWKPTLVFDDGEKTFIRFPRRIVATRAPVLFVLRSGKAAQFVNYRIKGDLYVVDRLLDAAELRFAPDGADGAAPEVVRIRRR